MNRNGKCAKIRWFFPIRFPSSPITYARQFESAHIPSNQSVAFDSSATTNRNAAEPHRQPKEAEFVNCSSRLPLAYTVRRIDLAMRHGRSVHGESIRQPCARESRNRSHATQAAEATVNALRHSVWDRTTLFWQHICSWLVRWMIRACLLTNC